MFYPIAYSFRLAKFFAIGIAELILHVSTKGLYWAATITGSLVVLVTWCSRKQLLRTPPLCSEHGLMRAPLRSTLLIFPWIIREAKRDWLALMFSPVNLWEIWDYFVWKLGTFVVDLVTHESYDQRHQRHQVRGCTCLYSTLRCGFVH